MKYEILLFDADETLFDFKKSEKTALQKAMLEMNIAYNENYHLRVYQEINTAIWKEFEDGLIPQQRLKIERFRRFADQLKIQFNEAEFATSYMKHLANASFLLDQNLELIKSLHQEYRMAIITNGLKDVQNTRIKKSPIGPYFEDIVISEEVEAAKPDPKIFEYALKHLGHTDKSKVLMVGDSLTSDIQGGINFAVDTCWFNPRRMVNQSAIQPTYQISQLMMLQKILRR
ncbi:MAG TPA: noncanonical pyrimidine nucleotidase, YjjG family [Firmicutes bacterium]|nr:noncanonical pyrimidine nucleotidase, YjjG family [Bacillota bacterium]